MAHLRQAEVDYYWANPAALVEEAGGCPNEFTARLSDETVFGDYAKVCLHSGKIPTSRELRIVQRELGTRTHTADTRFGSIPAFQDHFRQWLISSPDEQIKGILGFDGWASAKNGGSGDTPTKGNHQPQFHPFLPGCIQYLDVLARGEMPPFEAPDSSVSTLFEHRTADAFRCLGFEIQELGQGRGRNPDSIACAPHERMALIIDAKVRANGYKLGTEDRKFLDYAVTKGKELQREGYESIYLVVVGPSFRDSDLPQLENYLASAPLRGVVMLTARALMRMVEESIRERSRFSLSEFGKQLFGNKIIAS
jgi:hypothetical protein